jgi:hypothetical protein
MKPFDRVYPEFSEGLRTGSAESRTRRQRLPDCIRATRGTNICHNPGDRLVVPVNLSEVKEDRIEGIRP